MRRISECVANIEEREHLTMSIMCRYLEMFQHISKLGCFYDKTVQISENSTSYYESWYVPMDIMCSDIIRRLIDYVNDYNCDIYSKLEIYELEHLID